MEEIFNFTAPKLNLENEAITLWEHVKAFINAIDWSERWITSILVFHAFTFLFIIYHRKNMRSLSLLFISLLGLVYFSEYLNTWGAKNWKSFASFNYFDKNGTFTSFVFSFPVIINSVIILICFIRIMSDLLVKLKVAQLKEQQRANKQKTK